eukprot:COSAG01_NODE_10197_length_2223_cov_3.476930_2_plen_234_part_00
MINLMSGPVVSPRTRSYGCRQAAGTLRRECAIAPASPTFPVAAVSSGWLEEPSVLRQMEHCCDARPAPTAASLTTMRSTTDSSTPMGETRDAGMPRRRWWGSGGVAGTPSSSSRCGDSHGGDRRGGGGCVGGARCDPPIGAPCTQCLRHGDLIHARKALTAAAAAAQRTQPFARPTAAPCDALPGLGDGAAHGQDDQQHQRGQHEDSSLAVAGTRHVWHRAGIQLVLRHAEVQ